MSEFLSLFGFKERRSHLRSSLESPDESSLEKIEKRAMRNNDRMTMIREETTSLKSTPKSSNYKHLKKKSDLDSFSKTSRKYFRRSSIKKIENEDNEDDEYEDEFDENGDIRRSKRGRKPKKTYSPEKEEEKKKRRKRSLMGDSEEQKSVKRGKLTKKLENLMKGKLAPTMSDQNQESEKEQEDDESSDSSEASVSEFEEESDMEEEEEEEGSSSSSCAEDSEDEYQPASVTAKRKRNVYRRNSDTSNSYRSSLNDAEVLEKIENGEIPETYLYRADANTIFIPKLRAGMISGNGRDISVQPTSSDFFKFVRVRQKTKQDHAEPHKVRQLIQAVRRTPIIWDQRLTCHQDKNLVRRAWIRIDEELGEDPEYSLNRRRQIWKNKKDYYVNIVQTDLANQWIFTRDFEFYDPMVNYRAANIKLKSLKTNPDESSNSSKNLTCGPNDESHLMNFLLKSIHDYGMADEKLMRLHQNSIKTIFDSNFAYISAKFTQKTD